MNLRAIYKSLEHLSDKGSIHAFVDAYELLLWPYRQTAKAILEIGVWKGGSLLMWEQFFSQAAIVGLDCGHDRRWGKSPLPDLGSKRITCIRGDSTKRSDCELTKPFAPFDVIIDDGSHLLADQLDTFENLFPLLAPGGSYIVEDVGSVVEDVAKGEVLQNLSVSECLRHFTAHEPQFVFLDLRAAKGKYNDVLAVFRKEYR